MSPWTSIAGTPLVIAPIMATSLAARMLCGCIDIGTNTTRVLVAEPHARGLREILQRRSFTRLGRGLAPGGTIPAARIAETASVVAEQHALAEQAGASSIRAVATAVIRRAANRDEFCAAIRAHGGVEVCVLDGEEEARLAFLGATRTIGRALPGARRGGRRGRRFDRDRRGHDGRRRGVVDVASSSAVVSLLTRIWASDPPWRRRAARRSATHAARALAGDRPRAGRRRDRGRRQRGLAAAARGRPAGRAEPRRGRCGC